MTKGILYNFAASGIFPSAIFPSAIVNEKIIF
jgi:hypothetical protein